MADYHRMYLHLFGEVTKIINILQDAQQVCEEMFIEGDETPIELAQEKE